MAKGDIKDIKKDVWYKAGDPGPRGVGDHYIKVVKYYISVEGENGYSEVSREKLLAQDPGRKNITDAYLATFIGKKADILR